jgi:hypothetical protein
VSKYQKVRVEIPDVIVPLEAWHDPSITWNGFICPFFDEAGVNSIIEQTNAMLESGDVEPSEVEVLSWRKDGHVKAVHMSGTVEESVSYYEPDLLVGVPDWHWAIGSHAWTWMLAPEPEDEVGHEFTTERTYEQGKNVYFDVVDDQTVAAKFRVFDLGPNERGFDPKRLYHVHVWQGLGGGWTEVGFFNGDTPEEAVKIAAKVSW